MDLTAHATMSLTDAHGNIIEAIANAIDNARKSDRDLSKESEGR